MKFTQIAENTFKTLQLNAGILLKNFDPETGTIEQSAIIGATTGGVKFEASPEYTDFGEDIDNCPTNTKELKRLDSVEVKLSGTYVTVTAGTVKDLAAAADITEAAGKATKITPRRDLKQDDFKDYWHVSDYSDVDGGYVAIHLLNGLSTGGFTMQSNDKGKGEFDFEITGHVSMKEQDKLPYEIYLYTPSASTSA